MTRPNADLTQRNDDELFLYLVELMLLEVLMDYVEGVCVIGRAMRDLPEPYKTPLVELVDTPFANGGKSADEVFKIMNEAGLRSSSTAVTRHRRGTCACLRKAND